MGFYLSPQVAIKETDLSNIVPAVATSITAVAGRYQWGPCFDKKLITTEQELVSWFGEPSSTSDDLAAHWFSTANFLGYGNKLYVVRTVDPDTALNAGLAFEDLTGGAAPVSTTGYIPNEDKIVDYNNTIVFAANQKLKLFAKYPGLMGNNFKVSIANADDFATAEVVSGGINFTELFEYTPQSYDDSLELTLDTGEGASFAIGENIVGGTTGATAVVTAINGDVITVNTVVDTFADAEAITGDIAGAAVALISQKEVSTYFGIVVSNGDGILETWLVSSDPDAKDFENNSNYVENKINGYSEYIIAYDNIDSDDLIGTCYNTQLSGGVAGTDDDGDIIDGYDLFNNAEEFDVNIILDGGNNSEAIQQHILDNLCEDRKDCIGVFNVPKAAVVNIKASTAVTNCTDYKTKTLKRSSSYAALYGNWKMQYDKYNDKYRWVPISGDAAGIFARTDDQRDPWFAPAGLNRGQVKNVVKLAYNPNRAQRDILYKSQVNPIVSFAADGPVIFGQKTLQAKPSAFDRIDVRRLFIVLEKAISTASKYFLFEKNTAFTRRQLVGMIEPFLRTVQGRQGLYEFLVVCDERNNTPDVIDANQLNCDIFLQPTKTAEFIQLNFIATRTGVDFNELIGNV